MGFLDRLRRQDSTDDASRDAGLTVEELVPVGGSWSGLLFDNPAIGLLSQ